MLKLMEENSGVGQLELADDVYRDVRYQVARYQGFAESGMPIPGLFRLEGSIDMGTINESGRLVGSDLTLRLECGRAFRITVADGEGRILTEGHGPTRCLCC
jgi:hypothetical protein